MMELVPGIRKDTKELPLFLSPHHMKTEKEAIISKPGRVPSPQTLILDLQPPEL